MPPRDRPSVKIVVAAWGASYIARFAEFGLASMLAPGNLPAVAPRWRIEFVILTTAADIPAFERLERLNRARAYAEVRFETIDDLIVPGLFTVTLTLAYMRGMRVFGEAMTGSHFVFWNADFVLSDGAFSYLADRIDEGRKVVLAGSIRAVSEDVQDPLQALTDGEGALAASGRQMVRLALDHPHALQLAKTLDVGETWAESPNHMFWTAGPDAVVARFWQIFMLCLRPTRALSAIDGYCDYSFTAALCPGEPILVVGDSDEVCLLEMQGRDQDHEAVRRGPDREVAWRDSIAEWCTEGHLEVARQPILFHAGEPPAEAAEVVRRSGDYVEAMAAAVGPRFGHEGHYYWTAGVAAWNQRRPLAARAVRPPEIPQSLPLAALSHPSRGRFTEAWARRPRRGGGLAVVQRALVGDALKPKALHPDREAFIALAEAVRGTEGGRLVVADPHPWLDDILPPDDLRIDAALAEAWPLEPAAELTGVLIYLRAGAPYDAGRIVAHALGALPTGGRVTILAHDPAYGADESVIAPVLAAFEAAGLDQAQRRLVTAPKAAFDYAQALRTVATGAGGGRLGALLALLFLALRRLASRGGDGRPVVAILEGVR